MFVILSQFLFTIVWLPCLSQLNVVCVVAAVGFWGARGGLSPWCRPWARAPARGAARLVAALLALSRRSLIVAVVCDAMQSVENVEAKIEKDNYAREKEEISHRIDELKRKLERLTI